MSQKTITISEIGAIARGLLAQESNASVMGVTSRGLFLLLNSGWVVFLSPEAYQGPLTLNYRSDTDPFRLLQTKQSARIAAGSISIPDAGLLINTGQADTWEAPSIPGGILPPEQRAAQLVNIARHLLGIKQTSQLSELLPLLLGWVDRAEFQDNSLLPLLDDVKRSLHRRQATEIAHSLVALLGMGSGLTPSGDDVAIGFLLAMARWGHELAPDLDIGALGQMILPQAYRKTTTLSANMIDCALRGQANERLLLALDGILSGNADASACSSCLDGWGNTSGLDALLGISLAIGV